MAMKKNKLLLFKNALSFSIVLAFLSLVWGPALLFLLAIAESIFAKDYSLPSFHFGVIPALVASALFFFVDEKKFSNRKLLWALRYLIVLISLLLVSGGKPFVVSFSEHPIVYLFNASAFVVFLILILNNVLKKINIFNLSRYDAELIFIRSIKILGLIFFVLIVAIPFFVMIITSFKSQQELLLNPLDFSLDFSKGLDYFLLSYKKLLTEFNFSNFLLNSALVSAITVLITLAFSVPGAYAIARLRFPGRNLFFQGLLLIYMVPAIILVIPLYAIFSQLGLRDSFLGLLIVYPATTIPVALYMLQGYFKNIPFELEEAGLMDGLNRLAVIIKITLPLSLPALVSVSLYVFMIAWNEFLFAFMFLDRVEIFTLSRGIVSLNSSEVPRQYLMAGSVIATIPVIVLFLVLEKFLVSGLTAGSVKG